MNYIPKGANKKTLLNIFCGFYQLLGYWCQVATKEELQHIDKILMELHFYMRDRRQSNEKK